MPTTTTSSIFSDYVIYVDESGDHSLTSINLIYPCFVLTFCIFRKEEYIAQVVPSVQALKFKWWGHDAAILHTIDIKRELGDFAFLKRLPTKEAFMADVNVLIEQAPFTIVASVIDKNHLVRKFASPDNSYNIALKVCMENAYTFLKERGQQHLQTTIIVEERGKNEDRDLELEFRRIRDGANQWGEMRNFELRCCNKKANASGLQIADLVSTPICRKLIKPDQQNRAYELIEPKFWTSPQGVADGWGRKIHP